MRKKQTYKDYASDAFRFLAREGSKEKYIQKLVDDILKQRRNSQYGSPTEAAAMHKEAMLREKSAELADLEAAEKVMFILGRCERQAVEMVYMKDCWKELEWGEISERVHVAEIQIPAGQAQIYRWLAKARREFAKERGLRL